MTTSAFPPGWYPDDQGQQRWWNGHQWTNNVQPKPVPAFSVPTAARPAPTYVRQQTGHSVVKHIVFGWMALWIPTIYYAVSPNHYWHI